ncbi:MAG TPA: alpha/beta hydrolase [Candidatus Saccharimonadales bacterium]|nr:alpha/beta hydrolase [Candidatus Saccharimonadales bacterium]
MSAAGGEKPVFTLTPPHYHNAWAYRFLINELGSKGYLAHAPRLEISDPDMTRDDHAAVMREAEERIGAESYIRAGASWGGDLIYRELGSHVSKLVFLGAPLRPVLQRLKVPTVIPELANLPRIPYASYVSGERTYGFDREELGNVIYRNLGDSAVKNWAVSQLEPHPHTYEDPAKDENAVIPVEMEKHYVGLVNDEIFDYADQVRTAKFFGMEITPLTTGHFAMFEDPKKLAELFVEIAEDRLNKVKWAALHYEDRRRKLITSPSISVGKSAVVSAYA